MNVYSVRIIPRLKLKICEFFGLATTLAIDELIERLRRIDQKMDRFDGQLRRIHRQQMVIEAGQAKVLAVEKKKSSGASRARKSGVVDTAKVAPAPKAKARIKRPVAGAKVSSKRVVKKTIESVAKSIPAEQTEPIRKLAATVTEIPVKVVPSSESVEAQTLPLVLMIQSDEQAQSVVKDFFKGRAEVLTIKTFDQLPESLADRRIQAIFFERSLLGEASVRHSLLELQQALPKTQWVGLSNYLTLALSRAVEGEENFATYLTQPLQSDALAEVFTGPSLAAHH